MPKILNYIIMIYFEETSKKYFNKNGQMKKGIKRKLEEFQSLVNWYNANELRLPLIYSAFGSTWEELVEFSELNLYGNGSVTLSQDITMDKSYKSKIDLGIKVSWINDGNNILDFTKKGAIEEFDAFMYNMKYIKREIVKLQKQEGLYSQDLESEIKATENDLVEETESIVSESNCTKSFLTIKSINLKNGIEVFVHFDYQSQKIAYSLFNMNFNGLDDAQVLEYFFDKTSQKAKYVSFNINNRIQ